MFLKSKELLNNFFPMQYSCPPFFDYGVEYCLASEQYWRVRRVGKEFSSASLC